MKQSIQERLQASLRGTLLLFTAALMLWIGARQFHVVRARAAAATSACAGGRHCVFLPGIHNPPPGDLVLNGIEVTQSVQNSQNSVPLVAGRSTMLRIYTQAVRFNQPVQNVKVVISASSSGNATLSSSPQTYTATVPLSSSRADFNSTLDLVLPSAWTTGNVDLTIGLNPDDKIAERDSSNNFITQRLVFNYVPPLRIKIVPIVYHNDHDGHTYPAPTQENVSSWIMRTYPINKIDISWHAPYEFTGDLSTTSDFTRLLNEITTVKTSEGGAEGEVYYGLIPTKDGSTSWFSGGVAGIGWIGSRTAVGLDYTDQTSQLAAHEIGHNLGMWHTPCGGAAGPDPNYPYPDASIGQYGLDVSAGTVYAPDTKDVMSYCYPKWVSDYTYQKLFSGQVQYGAAMAQALVAPDASAAGTQRGLLVRANIHPDGVELLPAYVLPERVAQAPQAGDYQVQVLGENGQTLAKVPVRAYEAQEEGGIQMTGINAVIPLPDQPAAKLRLLKGGRVLAEQALEQVMNSLSASVTAERSGNTYRLRWNGAQKPALIRSTSDGGKTWTTLGVDVTGSDLSVQASALPDPNAAIQVIPAGEWK